MYIYNPIEDCYATKKKIDYFRKEIERRSKEKKKIEILDYGCGNANDCGKYLFNHKSKYFGFDIHKPSINFAKKEFNIKNVSFSSSLKNRKFDIIIISEVLEHLSDPTRILLDLKKKLKKDGFILGSIPNGYGLTEIEKYIIHKFYIYRFAKWIHSFFGRKKRKTTKIPFNYESGHIQFFTLRSFKKVLKKSNLTLENIINGTVMGADLSGSTFLKFNLMKKINTRTADFIPSFISATWIFKLRNNENY